MTHSFGSGPALDGPMVYLSHSRQRDMEPAGYRPLLLKSLSESMDDIGFTVWRDTEPALSRRANIISMGLATADAAVVLLDREALQSDRMNWEVRVLLWRRKLGLVLLPVLLPDLTNDDLDGSRMDLILKAETPLRLAHGMELDKAPTDAIAIANALRAHPEPPFANPARRWVATMVGFLRDLQPWHLRALADELKLSWSGVAATEDPLTTLVCSLLGADLDAVSRFLRRALGFVGQTTGEQRVVRQEVVSRAVPLWVDLDSARTVLDVLDLPGKRRVCGFELSGLPLARHVIARATASADEYAAVPVTEVAGEHQERELIDRFDLTLRKALYLADDSSPEFIESELAKAHAAVFALLHCRGLSARSIQTIVRTLSRQFPGVAFVIIADHGSHIWADLPRIPRPVQAQSKNDTDRVEYFVRRANALAGIDKPEAEDEAKK